MRQIIKRPNSRKVIIADRGSRKSSLGDVLRDRSKLSSSNSKDINKIWFEQKHIGREEHKKFQKKTQKLRQIKSKINQIDFKRHTNKKNIKIGLSVLAVTLMMLVIKGNIKENQNTTDTLGISSQGNTASTANASKDLEVVDKAEFEVLLPEGKSVDQLKLVKVSPPNNEPVYTYLDSIDDADLKISQQKLPESFNKERDVKLKELTDSFQATNVIQIDEQKVYHGYSEKTKTQSLIFIKNNLLITIASSQQLTDDVWVGYILGLQ
ncbi:MAG: hypothetical protein Q7T74_04940 [Candidatus Saccharibacteria bacterium]|nr:hypothetical protein [Candidatus Saccharibacteria bacterium]